MARRSAALYRTAARLALATADRLAILSDRLTASGRPDQSALDDPNSVKNLLIWSMDRLGDLARATPAIHALKVRYPAAAITLVAAGRAGSILRENPDITHYHQVDRLYRVGDHRAVLAGLKQTVWDLGVLLEVDPNWARIGTIWFRRLGVRRWLSFDFGYGLSRRAIGVPIDEHGSWIDQFSRLVASTGASAGEFAPRVYTSQPERDWAIQFLATHGIGPTAPFFVIHAGSQFLKVSRQWPPEAFAELITQMKERWSYPIVMTGVESERPVIDAVTSATPADVVDLCGLLNLRQLAAIVEASAVCIMNDTGPLHVAHALGKRTVVILGPTAAEVVAIPAFGQVVRVDLPCSPCAFLLGWKACHNPTKWECLTRISPEQVVTALAAQLQAYLNGAESGLERETKTEGR